MSAALSNHVEFLRPQLPTYEHILPYLNRIDASRWYSNFGPLVGELCGRLCKHFSMKDGEAATTCSATSGLISVLRAMNLPRDSYCVVPSWTFVGTPAAALAAEMIPFFVDVDEKSWALEPDAIKQIIRTSKRPVGAVIVVSPFGRKVDLQAWDKFSAETSIPVIIDAAAGFDHFRDAAFGKAPVVFSFHATKVFGAGEGGIVFSRDQALIQRVYEQTNFGFYTRHISTPGINGKMSEYTAAVALASLDNWPDSRAKWQETTRCYIERLEPLKEKYELNLWLDADSVASTVNIRLNAPCADFVISQLQVRGIQSRQWWDKGCHRQPAYSKYPKGDLTVTEALADSVVALPFYIDISKDHIHYIAENLNEILAEL